MSALPYSPAHLGVNQTYPDGKCIRVVLSLTLSMNYSKINVASHCCSWWGTLAQRLERRTAFDSWLSCFGTLAILFTPLCQCLSEETLLSGICARGSKISRTGGKCETCPGHHNSQIDHSCVLEWVVWSIPTSDLY